MGWTGHSYGRCNGLLSRLPKGYSEFKSHPVRQSYAPFVQWQGPNTLNVVIIVRLDYGVPSLMADRSTVRTSGFDPEDGDSNSSPLTK